MTYVMLLCLMVALVCSGYLFLLSVKILAMSKLYYSRTKKKCALQVKKIQDENCKLVSMSVQDFNNYLLEVFAKVLVISSSTNVSEKDPNAKEVLYAYALVGFMDCFSDVRESINYYYGESYLEKWFNLHYRLLEEQYVISKVVDKGITWNGITNALK